MTVPQPLRRRFLSSLAALVGLGALGGIAWAERKPPLSEPGVVAGSDGLAATTTIPPMTTLPPVSTTTTPTSTTSSTPTTTSTSTSTTTTEPLSKLISAVCPEAWGALPVAGEFKQHTIERITVHHTAVVLDDNRKAPARARQHQAYHQERGWPDLAYHYLVDADGNVYEGRPVDAVGDTGTEYDPTGHFLICCEGHFDEQETPQAQLEALVDMLAWAAGEFNVSPETIRGHRDWAETTCPGDDLYAYIASGFVEDAVKARLDEGGVLLQALCGNEAVALVAEIEAGAA